MKKYHLKFAFVFLLLISFLFILGFNLDVAATSSSVMPSGYRPIASADLARTFGVDLEPIVYINTDNNVSATSTSQLIFENGFTFDFFNTEENATEGYSFDKVQIENSSGTINVQVLDNDYVNILKWYDYYNGWADYLISNQYAMNVANSTISINGDINDYSWLYVKDKSSAPLNYTVTLLPGGFGNTEFPINGLYYSSNQGATYLDISNLPQVINNVNSIRFSNVSNQTSYLIVSRSQTENIIFTLYKGQTSIDLEITDDTILYLSYSASADSQYIISGGYRFYTSFNLPNSTISNFPYAYDLNFKVYGQTAQTYSQLRFSESSFSGKAWTLDFSGGQGFYLLGLFNSSDSTPSLFTFDDENYETKYRYLVFAEQVVSKDVYDLLNAMGEFGNFTPPNEDDSSNTIDLGSSLLLGLNSFLSFELVPGFSLNSLLALCVAVPLLIYILKLFLGG